jgi:hypothetical protein
MLFPDGLRAAIGWGPGPSRIFGLEPRLHTSLLYGTAQADSLVSLRKTVHAVTSYQQHQKLNPTLNKQTVKIQQK